MPTSGFFEAPGEQSIIKTKLVTQYFDAWSKIMLPHASNRIGYVDLFAGPGAYDNGKDSTPIWVLKYAISNEKLRSRLISIFNDKERTHAEKLRTAIDALPEVTQLGYTPQVLNLTIGSQVIDILWQVKSIPTLYFIDPYGYKGLTMGLIGTAIKAWGSECIFFFNYNRINAAMGQASVPGTLADLFGAVRLRQMQEVLQGKSPKERTPIILNGLNDAVREVGGRYTLPFTFWSRSANRISHHIVFVTKHPRGLAIMKDIMHRLSSDEGDVRNFEYNPAKSPQLQLPFDLDESRSITPLKDLLAQSCAGVSLSVGSIYLEYCAETRYTRRHVREALLELEDECRIDVHPPADRRPKRNGKLTLADDVIVTFPR